MDGAIYMLIAGVVVFIACLIWLAVEALKD